MSAPRPTAPARLFNRDFVLLWQGQAVSAVGNVLYSIAIGIWVYQQTGSTALMGVMSSISYFASLVLQPFAGVLVDLCSKRALIVGADALRGVGMLWLGWYALRGTLAVWQVLALAAVAAVCNVIFSPASISALPLLAPKGQLVRAQSLVQGTLSVIRLVGNAASGALVVALGVPVMILLNGGAFLLSAVTEWFIRFPPAPHSAAQTPRQLAAAFGQGLALLRTLPGVVGMILAGAAVNLFCGGFGGIVYVWCLQKGMTVPQYGLFLAAEGLAALAGTLALTVCPLPPAHRPRLFVAAYALQAVLYLAAMATRGFWPCTVLYLASMFFNAIGNMMILPALLQLLPQEYHGRSIALFAALSDGGMALSMLLYGVLSEYLGVTAVALGGAVLALLPSAFFCTDRTLRKALALG